MKKQKNKISRFLTVILSMTMMFSIFPSTVNAMGSKVEKQNAPLASSYEIFIFTLTPYDYNDPIIFEIPGFDTNTMEIYEVSGSIDIGAEGNLISYNVPEDNIGLDRVGETETIGTVNYSHAGGSSSFTVTSRIVNSITFNAESGTFTDGSSQLQIGIDNGNVLTMPDDPTIGNGQYFDGWYYRNNDGDFATEFVNGSLLANATVYAKYTTDAEKLAEAKSYVELVITDNTTTNSTTAESILSNVNDYISTINDVTASWKEEPTITKADISKDGSIVGTIVLTYNSETLEVAVNMKIKQLENPKVHLPIDGSSFKKNSDVLFTFVLYGNSGVFDRLYVDGQLLDSENYLFTQNSTSYNQYLRFKNEYLNTLSVGEHTFKVEYKEGALAESKFTVSGTSSSETPTTPEEKPTTPEEKPTTPEEKPATPEEKPVIKETGSTSTGDASSTMIYMSLIALSGCAVVYGLKKRKA